MAFDPLADRMRVPGIGPRLAARMHQWRMTSKMTSYMAFLPRLLALAPALAAAAGWMPTVLEKALLNLGALVPYLLILVVSWP